MEDGEEGTMFGIVGEARIDSCDKHVPYEVKCINALISAIIERAIFDWYGSDKTAAGSAAEWIFGEEFTDDDPWSFEWACDHIGYCASKIRRLLRSNGSNFSSPIGTPRKKWCRHRIRRVKARAY